MNPLSHHQMGQDQHREYEARYGNRYPSNEAKDEADSPLGRHKLALVLSSASLAALVLALVRLF